MQKSRLPEGGQNLFQEIKKRVTVAEAAGKKIWRLGIGQPSGPALMSARVAACQAVMRDDESMHEYQDNGSPGVPGFAKEFVGLHEFEPLKDNLAYLPIPGIKPMLGLIPLACGHVGFSDQPGLSHARVKVATMTDPGYPTPAAQCQYLCVENYALETNTENEFLFCPENIKEGTTLLMLNYPHNPSGQVMMAGYWELICKYCLENNIRIFNDAAYAMLNYDLDAATLASVAQGFPNLSWCEAYSASKVIANGTGWRVGAMVGSPDFIADIATIKGNTDSGFFAPAAHGVLACMQNDMASIMENRDVYYDRNMNLCKLLHERGMKIAVRPSAGFFSLWLAPSEAFGQKIQNAEQFNYLMIEKTGVVGVHFGPYIRYSVTSPIEKPEWQEAITNAFEQANVKY